MEEILILGTGVRYALIADTFPPLRSSGAVQVRDLSLEFHRQGHEVTVFVADSGIKNPWELDTLDGVRVLRLKSPKTKDVGYIRRTAGEFLMPHWMLRNFRRCPLADESWDGIVWYSPTIFLGPFVNALKRSSKCRGYLIVRDIFPEWAVDLGLMGKGPAYWFFKTVATYQYSIANVIGVQSPGNLAYFEDIDQSRGKRVEVLQNWLSKTPNVGCSINLSKTQLSNKIVFVYAGNMGVAQGMDLILELAVQLNDRKDIGFLFVGRGSEFERMRLYAKSDNLDNVVFFDQIDPSEIPGLYAQCHVGLLTLDLRHKTHNIPGKFLSYMQGGLPVLASVNAGNDLEKIINEGRVGRVCTDHSAYTLSRLAIMLVEEIVSGKNMSKECRKLSDQLFSSSAAVQQITESLLGKDES